MKFHLNPTYVPGNHSCVALALDTFSTLLMIGRRECSPGPKTAQLGDKVAGFNPLTSRVAFPVAVNGAFAE